MFFPLALGQLPGSVHMEGRGAHGFKKVSGVLGSGFVNTEEEEVVWVFFFVFFFQGTTNT